MARPPHAREKVLDAFEALVIEGGERAATMDATAQSAGVSKGGLIYHFPSKEALEAGLIERMDRLVADDVAAMAAWEAGILDAFIRSSTEVDTPLDRAIVAVSRLASTGSEPAQEAMSRMRELWRTVLSTAIPDPTSVTLALLVADGVYFNSALTLGAVPDFDMDALVAILHRAVGDS